MKAKAIKVTQTTAIIGFYESAKLPIALHSQLIVPSLYMGNCALGTTNFCFV